MANLRASEILEQIEQLETKTNSLHFRINDPKQYRKDFKKLERLRKQFIKATSF